MSHPPSASWNVILMLVHQEVRSLFPPFEPRQTSVIAWTKERGDTDAVWLLRLGPKRQFCFCLVFSLSLTCYVRSSASCWWNSVESPQRHQWEPESCPGNSGCSSPASGGFPVQAPGMWVKKSSRWCQPWHLPNRNLLGGCRQLEPFLNSWSKKLSF